MNSAVDKVVALGVHERHKVWNPRVALGCDLKSDFPQINLNGSKRGFYSPQGAVFGSFSEIKVR